MKRLAGSPSKIIEWTSRTLSDPAWTVPNYALPGEIVDAIIAASAVLCFCTADDGTNSTLITTKNASFVVPTAATAIVATPTMNTQTMDSGATWYSVRGATTEWYWYDTIVGFVQALGDSTALGNFIN